jgi:hypothetical protein
VRSALELDLRKDNDLERSRLLHRMRVLGIAWGEPAQSGRGAGTFRESWQLAWQPELAVELIAANLHGNTIEVAAGAALQARARDADLAQLTALIEVALLAHLPAAQGGLLAELDRRAAGSSDVRAQLTALEPLARVVRYGDVRATRAEHVLPVLRALFERALVGLLPACTQLDADAAAEMLTACNRAHAACMLLDDASMKGEWLDALGALMRSDPVHPRIRGRATRLLLEHKALADGELEQRASLALSTAIAPEDAASWIEGLVAGEGLLLVHQTELLAALDAWLNRLADEPFNAQLPLLRRAFSGLSAPERRAIASQLKRGLTVDGDRARRAGLEAALEPEWVSKVTPVLAHILGVAHD